MIDLDGRPEMEDHPVQLVLHRTSVQYRHLDRHRRDDADMFCWGAMGSSRRASGGTSRTCETVAVQSCTSTVNMRSTARSNVEVDRL